MRAHRAILALKLAIFDPCFVHIAVKYKEIELKILPQYPPLQPQHMLQISAHLYCPGMRSIFEGDGGLKDLSASQKLLFT